MLLDQPDYPIAITEQSSATIRVLGPEGVSWEWSPGDANAREAAGWGLPSDVKLRNHAACGGLCVVVADSRGYTAIVAYPSKDVLWSRVVGGNPHAAELLPDGNIAVAASDGGWVRIYTASQGPASDRFGEAALPGAHGVLWDPERQLLWAVGDDRLIALHVAGPPAAPVLELVVERKLPSLWGHDLCPVYGDSGRLWVTTNGGVYQYVKASDAWSADYPGADRACRAFVKSMGNQPSGTLVQTVPKQGVRYAWGTDTVDFFMPDRKLELAGTSIYKARIWCADYQ